MAWQRVVVVGPSCAGKSTFARALATSGTRRCVDLDDLYWAPDWQPQPTDVFLRRVQEELAGPAWVVAGNYRVAREVVWARASAVVWLDLPLPLVLWRCLQRTWLRCSRRELLPHGNRESFRRAFFSRDSLFLWIWNTHARRRDEFRSLQSGPYASLKWFRVRDSRRAAEVLRHLQQS